MDDAVEGQAVVEPFAGELAEVLHRVGRVLGEQLETIGPSVVWIVAIDIAKEHIEAGRACAPRRVRALSRKRE